MKFTYYVLVALFLVSFGMSAQEALPNEPRGADYVGTIESVTYVEPLINRTELPAPDLSIREAQDKKSMGNTLIPGKDPQVLDDYFKRNPSPDNATRSGRAPDLTFVAGTSGSHPTDPTMAVGPNHVIVTYNTAVRIFDKDGNSIMGPFAPNPTIFPSGGCCDLTVSYDNAADRWVLSFLGAGAQFAVSDGPDPTTAGWNVYNIPQINDYQKLSIWSDGYYVTDNTGSSLKVWALERDEMLAGNGGAGIQSFQLPGMVIAGFHSPQALHVTDGNMPAAGAATIVYMQDDAWSGAIPTDHLKYWFIDVDWVTPANSTVSAATQLATNAPFISTFDGGSFSNLSQPGGGPDIDALQWTIMNQAQFRKFGGHNSAVFTFVVDTDAGGGELAGIRWFELRQAGDGQPWTIHQESTYLAPDGKHAWNGSITMDAEGNMAMGYTSMAGPTTPNPTDNRVSSHYTGRLVTDPDNTMTIAEELIWQGTHNIPLFRYVDYSKIEVDPSDDLTFWHINEVMNNSASIRSEVVGRFFVSPSLGVDDITTGANDLQVITQDNDQFQILWKTQLDGLSTLKVYDIDGRVVFYDNLEKEGDRYQRNLNMSYAAAGVYVISMTNRETSVTENVKIIVK